VRQRAPQPRAQQHAGQQQQQVRLQAAAARGVQGAAAGKAPPGAAAWRHERRRHERRAVRQLAQRHQRAQTIHRRKPRRHGHGSAQGDEGAGAFAIVVYSRRMRTVFARARREHVAPRAGGMLAACVFMQRACVQLAAR
jgi:hypothetical protein